MRCFFVTTLAALLACRYAALPSLDNRPDAGSIDSDGGSDGYGLVLLAGTIGGPGYIDGSGSAAMFDQPCGIAVDDDGIVYVSDTGNDVIRVVTPRGVVTTLAGVRASGATDGTASDARFNFPEALSYSGSGFAIADTFNHTIRFLSSNGQVSTVAGYAGLDGSSSGYGTSGRFNTPFGVVVDRPNDAAFVADTLNCSIRHIDSSGLVTTFAGNGTNCGFADGSGSNSSFTLPMGITLDSVGTLYVTDYGAIRKITAAGVVTTLAGGTNVGSVDAMGSAAEFDYTRGIAVDSEGNAYVTDSGNYTIRKITPSGVVTTLAGLAKTRGNADGVGSAARFGGVCGLAFDKTTSSLYVTDLDTIRRIGLDGTVTTIAGQRADFGSTDGTGADARFGFLGGVGLASSASGSIYVADSSNATIRAISATSDVSTVAGLANVPGAMDGSTAAATFNYPTGIAFDADGTLYIADANNGVIRTLSPSGQVATLAGTAGNIETLDGSGASAAFESPWAVAFGPDDVLYVADYLASTIRAVTPHGAVTTFAGIPDTTGSVDGAGSAATFDGPSGIGVDADNNIYVADTNNSTIRKISPDGAVTTLAGAPGLAGSIDGPGSTAAELNMPDGIAIDVNGNLYVADTMNSTIRRITPSGETTTIAGTPGRAQIVLGATPGFSSPEAIAIVGDSLVITDSYAVLMLRHALAAQ
jgi:sugar lactone lactonase YvrE